MRVSKADGSQVLDLQRDALLAAGAASDRLYQDHASGKRDDRPGLDACLKSLRNGDTLVAWKLDRIGRDLRHLVNLVHDLTTRGVGLGGPVAAELKLHFSRLTMEGNGRSRPHCGHSRAAQACPRADTQRGAAFKAMRNGQIG